jgi:tRNA-specific 2-thiouridylase
MIKNKKIVVLGMSGGVDSSVALFLLKEQGFQVLGVSLKFGYWEGGQTSLRENVYCSEESIKRAKRVCEKYNCPHFIIDVSKEFGKSVIDYFLESLKNNKTPNPCVFCNRDVKVSALLRFAEKKKADYIATGHYARIKESNGKFQLLRAKDNEKDQTYFLAFLGQAQLAKLILPLGDYLKKDIYTIAEKEGIEIAVKESQDLCFINNNSIPNFLEKEIGSNPGKIQDTQGNVLGEHKGLHFYTIGQRRGVNLPGGPFWVTNFDVKNNTLIVTDNSDDLKLFSKRVILSNVNFISGKKIKAPLKVEAKIRYRQPLAKAKLICGSRTSAHWELVFDEPQKAVTIGQIAVFYNKDVCIGAGEIGGRE